MSHLLSVENLNVTIQENKATRHLLHDIHFQLKKHECLGIVGESGSGKSLTCQAIMGLLNKQFTVSGSLFFKQQNLLTQPKDKRQDLRGKSLCMVVQHPMNAFDPLYRLGYQMVETFCTHLNFNQAEAKQYALAILHRMQLNNAEDIFNKYPHQVSGGMLQRIVIGLAIAMQPELIIADEPTTALDSITQFSMIKEFIHIREKLGTSMIFVSHDLGVINQVADNILVMNNGHIVEGGNKQQILHTPTNCHTHYLINTRKKLLDKYYQTLNQASMKADFKEQECVI